MRTRVLRRLAAQPNVLFGGVYGAVLASSMVAALTQYGARARADRLYDAKWLLITAVASALAHGYAHIIARRGDETHHGGAQALGILLDEWPLVAATLPTVLVLDGAGLGWWGSRNIEYVVFALNIVLLFGWGLLAARAAGRTWRSGVKLGVADGLLGVIVVVANAVIK
ncbi:hypothetical protein ACFYZ9_18550 [Streptomyces sp. NPDC001691]|uniref:hypothetical protein n=1 Tax=unclassified Streptomyces TaxID=2593676 RepID=UPI000DE94D78|nr:hypothetical protein [Streptomyces sp. SDr-06]RCH67690.1 hypothetical protein DT019_15660 [Streptomyces sp. SDr-06]